MSSSSSSSLLPPMVVVLLLSLVFFTGTFAQLSPDFYSTSCPNLTTIVTSRVLGSITSDIRAAARLVNLHYRDCFVHGCDASILLDGTREMSSEKETAQNSNVRGFDIVDDIKTAVERDCRGVVSCADILALSSQIAIVLSGGPSYTVLLGRRDSQAAYSSGVDGIPGPYHDPSRVISLFNDVGLDTTDVVALSGAHTIGAAPCGSFMARLYNFNGTNTADPTIDPPYLLYLRTVCPGFVTLLTRVVLDPQTPNIFDNSYYKNLLLRRGLLRTDQDLYTESATSGLVTTFANNQSMFFSSFVNSMIKMGNISPLTGLDGQIRENCRFVNA